MSVADDRDAVVDAIRRAMMRLGRHLHRSPLPGGLTPPQYFVLRMLSCCSVRPSDLAEALQVTPGTVTPLIDRLIDSGLVTRSRDAEDRRVLRLSLTPLGQERLAQIDAWHHGQWQRLLAGLDDDEARSLQSLLDKVLASLEEFNPDAVDIVYARRPQ